MNKSLLVSSLGLVLLFLVHVARIPTEPVALEDIFASLETPVQPRSPLPSARDFTSPLFTRRGMGRDSLVQKMHRLEAKKKILEEKKAALLKGLEGERDRAVDATWRGAISAHKERLERAIGYAQRKLREKTDAATGRRGRRDRRLVEDKGAWLAKEAERTARVRDLEGLLKGYDTSHRGAKDVAAERRASSVLQALGTLEEAVQGLQGARQRAVLTADVLRVEHVVLDGHR